MKKFAIIAIVGSLGLAACDGNADTPDPVEVDDSTANTNPNEPVAVGTMDEDSGEILATESGEVDETISEDGVAEAIDVE